MILHTFQPHRRSCALTLIVSGLVDLRFNKQFERNALDVAVFKATTNVVPTVATLNAPEIVVLVVHHEHVAWKAWSHIGRWKMNEKCALFPHVIEVFGR